MGDTSIEWTDATWNPVRGCTRISEGCRNCYAERFAARFSKRGLPFHLFAEGTPAGPRWTGLVEIEESALEAPLHWRRPRKVFVNSMSDLFHEALTDADIYRVFEVMREAHWHTFQVLTKRATRMLRFVERYTEKKSFVLPHLWLGVSVEDQEAARSRIPYLLDCAAAVRFVSAEPLLGSVILRRWMGASPECADLWRGRGLDWVIVGGESGPGARTFEPEWARMILRECRECDVAFFMKQLGGTLRKRAALSEIPEDLRVREFPEAAMEGAPCRKA